MSTRLNPLRPLACPGIPLNDKRSGKESKPEVPKEWVQFLFWDNKRSNESERSDMFDLSGANERQQHKAIQEMRVL